MMDWEYEVDPEDTTRLRNTALGCKNHIQELLKNEEAQDDAISVRQGYWASRQCFEFNLWCTMVGVYGEGLQAMDVRLKDVPVIFKLLEQGLQSLERYLEELQNPAKHLDDAQSDSSLIVFMSLSSSEESEEEGASSTSEVALRRHIEDTIDRLHGYTRLIDYAGARHRRERIELYRQKEGPKWAYEGYKRLANQAAKTYFPLASEAFRQRIGESFARRRIRFEIPDGVTYVSKSEEPTDVSSQSVPQDQHTIYSATVNTKLDMQPQAKRQERAESVASVALRHPGFPPPPQVCDETNSFQCPYCRLEFRACEAGRDRWSQHVIQDFEPYFCVLEECKQPFDVTNSFDGLLEHLQGHLEERYHVDMPDGEHKEFDEAEFEKHIAQHGHGKISAEEISIMKKASRRKGPFLFESCPFCGGYPDVVEKRFPNLDTPEAQTALRKHIKQHMQDIAFFLPPYRDDISNEDDDLKSSVVTGQSAKLDNFEDPGEFLEICGREDCDCRGRGRHVSVVLEDELAVIPAEQDLEDADIQAELIVPEDLDHEDTDLWAELFPNSAPYDQSPVPDEYYLGDVHLRSFIARLSPPSAGYRELESVATTNSREYTLTELVRASQDCMKSLAFPEMNAGFDNAHTAEHTCEWLFRHHNWIEWDDGNQNLLWINGKPGTGKSTLLKYLLTTLREVSNAGTGDVYLSFFFSHYGVELQRTPFGFYRSLLYQILQQIPDVLPDLISTFEQRREESGEPGESWQWHTEELQKFLQSALLKLLKTRPVWLFIDSLDACGQENAANLTQEFKSLVQILSGSFKRFRVCLTCRTHLNLDPNSVLQICLENENQGDLLRFIQAEFSTSPMLSSSDIENFIIENVRGVFTLARLLVKQVLELDQEGTKLHAIKEEMVSISPILQLYHHLLAKRGSLSWPLRTIDDAITKLVLDDDAEAFFENTYRETPLSWARARGHHSAVRLLLEKGAKTELNIPPFVSPTASSTAVVAQDSIPSLSEPMQQASQLTQQKSLPIEEGIKSAKRSPPITPAFLSLSQQDIHKKYLELRKAQPMGKVELITNTPPNGKSVYRYQPKSVPWMHAHVKLRVPENTYDYITASPITLTSSDPNQPPLHYFAMQGEIKFSFNRVWRMIAEQTSSFAVIVQFPRTVGLDVHVDEYCQYFPMGEEGATWNINDDNVWGDNWKAQLTLESLEEIDGGAIEKRKLVLRISKEEEKESRIIWHLVYKRWPDDGVPTADDINSLLELIKLSEQLSSPNSKPIVHCSPNIGRAGCFIALHRLIRELSFGVFERYDVPSEGPDLVYYIAEILYKQRWTMVQIEEQYRFVYQVIRKLWCDKYGVLEKQADNHE
ncbi:hypothetical protein J3F84DRAFT_408721 [Trichoderma pleuroticola]